MTGKRTLINTSIRAICALQLCSFAAYAALSDSTSIIEGRAPMATGELNVLLPGGTARLQNNAVLGASSLSMKPNQFVLAQITATPAVPPDPLVSVLTAEDEDGDTGLAVAFTPADARLTWKIGATKLTDAELALTLDNFMNKTLTVTASVPVTVSTLTGVPNMHTAPLASSYQLTVLPHEPEIISNGTAIGLNDGFPHTGFKGAFFTFWMNGLDTVTNSNYTWSVDQTWLTVTNGVVKFIGEPTNETRVANITITDKNGIFPPLTHTIKLQKWFITPTPNTRRTWDSAKAWCDNYGQGYHMPALIDLTTTVPPGPNGTAWPPPQRDIGLSVMQEWGMLNAYAGGGTSWPAAENRGNVYSSDVLFGQHTSVYIDGRALAWDDTAQFYTACVKYLNGG